MSGSPQTLVDLLREAQARFADRLAISNRDGELTYRDLWLRVVALAKGLRGAGVQTGDRIALLIENSPEYVVSYYATLLAGGVAVGLNTALRSGELARNIRHCEPSLLIASPDHPELSSLMATNCVASFVLTGPSKAPLASGGRTISDLVAAGTDLAEWGEPLSNAAASIIYTSGTTGDPKGVTLSHANLVANTRSIVQYLGLTERDRIVNVLPFFYSYGNSVLHTHLAVGASIVLENSLSYPHLVIEKIAETKATGFAGVPSTFALLLQRVNLANFDLSSLRYVTQAGGAMQPVLTRKLRDAMPAVDIFVMYGQTEATARLTYLPPQQLEAKVGSVGIAVPGVEIRIRDELGEAAAVGVTGEVWVRGANVMLGYWRDTLGTANVLRDGWLKTGDMGYLDSDGYLFLHGRRSDMIKAGAHRIHPKDIEDVIAEHPGVAEVAVVGIEDELLGQAIKAVVVAKSNVNLVPLQVQAHCKQRLASYKVPKIVVMVAALPKTATGKVRRVELERGELN